MLIPPRDTPTPTTQIAAVIGDPVSHSLSPRLHNAGFNALGLDWTYIACRVPDGKGEEAVTDMRAKGFRGLSVTMPHKAAAARAVDEVSPTAAKLGVVNCVRREGDRLGRVLHAPAAVAPARGWRSAGHVCRARSTRRHQVQQANQRQDRQLSNSCTRRAASRPGEGTY